jgi:hypothetical protein
MGFESVRELLATPSMGIRYACKQHFTAMSVHANDAQLAQRDHFGRESEG